MPRGDLFIIGGREDKRDDREILSKFVEVARRNEGKVGVLTTATNYPVEVGGEYKSIFEELSEQECILFDIHTREQAEDRELSKELSKLSGLFMTGGDQVRLTSILGGTLFYAAMQQMWRSGMVIGGTSAGAAVQSRHMIMSSTITKDDEHIVEMGSGFGFLEDAIIDQHFSQRARFIRLMNAIAHNPQIIGIGIDENTAVWVQEEGRFFEVLGEHTVTIFDGKSLTYVDVAMPTDNSDITMSGVRMHLLAKGYKFDLIKRELILQTGAQNNEDQSGQVSQGA